jgi:hypothetical protein
MCVTLKPSFTLLSVGIGTEPEDLSSRFSAVERCGRRARSTHSNPNPDDLLFCRQDGAPIHPEHALAA